MKTPSRFILWALLLTTALPLVGTRDAKAAMTFGNTHRRYLSGRDILRFWFAKFPSMSRNYIGKCLNLSEIRDLVAVPRPATGEPISNTPNPAFLSWYMECTDEILREEFGGSSEATPLFSDELMRRLTHPSSKAVISVVPREVLSGWTWSQIPADGRQLLVRDLIDFMIGPGVLAPRSKLYEDLIAITAGMKPELKVSDAVRTLLTVISLRDEFLTY